MDWEAEHEDEELASAEVLDDPGASRRFWFEHATGAGKTVAAVGFIEASRTGGILILTHRRNLVDQFIGEISDRGYAERLSPPILGEADHPYGPITVETYQWFVRNAGKISDAYSIVICDEAHTALGEKTSACIRAWTGPVFIGMTATGALDRPPRRRPLPDPDVPLRPGPGRAPRRHLAAALHPHPAGTRRAHDRQRAPAKGRGGPGLRPGGAGEAPRPDPLQRRDRRPLQVAVPQRARRHLRRRREARQQRRQGLPGRGHQRPRRLGRDPEARAGRDPGRIRARRGRRPLQRDAARRGLELAPRDDLHAPGAHRLEAHLPAARRPRHPPEPRQGGRPGPRLRAPGDDPRRERHHPPQPARPRRLSRRRDRRRPGAPWPRAPRPGREARRPGLGRLPAPPRGARARALAHRRREPGPPRAARLGRARRCPRQPVGLAARQGDAPARLDQGAPPPLPADLRPAQPELAAAAEGPRRDRAAARPRGLRRRDRHGRNLDPRRPPRRDPRPARGPGRAPHRPPRPGPGVVLAPRRLHPRPARGVRGPAVARDEAPARPAGQLFGPGPRAKRPPPGPRRPQPGPPPRGGPARRRGRPHPRGRGGAARRPHARGPQAVGRGPRAAQELPQVGITPPAPQAQGRGGGNGGNGAKANGRGGGEKADAKNGAEANGAARKRKPRRRKSAAKPRAAAADSSED